MIIECKRPELLLKFLELARQNVDFNIEDKDRLECWIAQIKEAMNDNG